MKMCAHADCLVYVHFAEILLNWNNFFDKTATPGILLPLGADSKFCYYYYFL